MTETESMPAHEVWFYRAVWVLIVFAICYFTVHVAVAVAQGNIVVQSQQGSSSMHGGRSGGMGNHVCGPRP